MGASGTAVTFVTAAEFMAIRDIEKLLGYPIECVLLGGYDWDPGREAAEAARPARLTAARRVHSAEERARRGKVVSGRRRFCGGPGSFGLRL